MSGDGSWMNTRSYNMPKTCMDFVSGCGCYLLMIAACAVCAWAVF